MKPTIIMIDDDSFYLEQYKKYLQDAYNVLCAENTLTGADLIEEHNPDLILLDISMRSENEGLDILPAVKEKYPWIPVIIITNHDKHSVFRKAMENGATDYFVKTSPVKELHSLIQSALLKMLPKEDIDGEIVVRSPMMKKIFADAQRIAGFDTSVLISGASGCGKEVLARFIHQNSGRKNASFVAVNCGRLTDTLIESELFGHEKGAFTGAIARHTGAIEKARSGTLFLDELEDLSPRGQAALLRVLQDKEMGRLGGTKKMRVDFRLMAAVKTDITELIKSGRFREDLYYRISMFIISIPPLHKRKKDILPLAYFFMRRVCKQNNLEEKTFSQSALRLLKTHNWPGNVRELQNAVKRAVIFSARREIGVQDLKIEHQYKEGNGRLSYEFAKNNLLKEFKEDFIGRALARNNGNISETARNIGLSRQALQKMIKELGFDVKPGEA